MDDHTGPAPRDDPSARARADVLAILSRAPGLRRIVELAREIRAQSQATPAPAPVPQRNRAEHQRHRPQTG